jgi:hypothetical protein
MLENIFPKIIEFVAPPPKKNPKFCHNEDILHPKKKRIFSFNPIFRIKTKKMRK